MVYLFGSDGTGKTTHADLLAKYLERNGYRIRRATVKQHHTLSYVLLKLLTYKKPDRESINYYGFNCQLGKRIRTPWKIIELVSVVPAVFYRVLLPLFFGYLVICDRYLLDTLVTLSYFLAEPKFLSSRASKVLLRLIPKRSLLVYCEADTDLILQRKKDEPLTAQLVEYYKSAYRKLSRWCGLEMVIVDTGKNSADEVQAKLQPLIMA
jgi:thymidylate kinase